MDFNNKKLFTSHGTGKFRLKDFRHIGKNVIFERGVLVFHPENISINNNVYIGHYTILKGYYKNVMNIGEGSWIGQFSFLHSAGNINIGKSVGIGPYVKILTSSHNDENIEIPILHSPIEFGTVEIGDGADIGIGSIILPGIFIGEGAIVGAGSVVTKNVEPYSVYAGVPAK